MRGDFENIIRDIDSVFDIFNRATMVGPVSRLPTVLVSSAFPPADIYEEEDGVVYELAVAGYKEDEIGIKFENDYLHVSLNPKDRADCCEGDDCRCDKASTRKYWQTGLKRGAHKAKYFAPSNKYDASQAVAKLADGILTIRVPMREAAKPRDVKIEISK